MTQINVKPNDLKNISEKMNQINKILLNSHMQLELIALTLNLKGDAGAELRKKIKGNASEIITSRTKTTNLSNALKQVASLYRKAEESVISKSSGLKSKCIDEDPTNPAFDGKGQYGGDQGSPRNNRKELEEIIKKYHPEFTKKQMDNYLEKLNSEGCGYVAITNTLFAYFVGRELEFEKIFGFPMRKANGELNYDALVTDFYSATDNHNMVDGKDVVDNNEDESNVEGYGTTRGSREYRFEMYMNDHGIDCDVQNVNITANNFEEMQKKGDIVVGISPVQLYDSNGKLVFNSDGGHAMTVTGVTEDGMLKVSSWGEEYYIKPGTYSGHETYQQVIYK